MARKSFDVRTAIDEVNRRNRESTCAPTAREGWNDMLEFILLQTDNYKGFGYLASTDIPSGQIFPDETRRFYY